MDKIVVYTDGWCRWNHLKQNIWAWWAVLRYGDSIKEIAWSEINTTNNKMELLAPIQALKQMTKFDKTIDIYTDSAYLYNCMTKRRYQNRWKNWRKNAKWQPVENKTLREELLDLIKKFPKVNFYKVLAHSGDKYNEMVDGVVNREMDKLAKKLNMKF